MSSNINSSYFLKWTNGRKLFQVISSNRILVPGKRATSGAEVFLSGADLQDGPSHHWARLGNAKASFWKRTMLLIVFFLILLLCCTQDHVRYWLPPALWALISVTFLYMIMFPRQKQLCLLSPHDKQYFLRWTLGVQRQRKPTSWNWQ